MTFVASPEAPEAVSPTIPEPLAREVHHDVDSVAIEPTHRKADLFGVKIDAVEPDGAFDVITSWAKRRHSAAVAFMPVHSLVTAVNSRPFAAAIADFGLVVADGQPVRWMLNAKHKLDLNQRVYGPAMMWRLCEWAQQNDESIYLLGGKPEVLSALVTNVREAFPDLRIAGAESPPFRALSDDEVRETAERIAASGASLTFVGLGCPKQELLADRLGSRTKSVLLCVGAAFDFHAGMVRSAPSWMQDHGLEWLFRLSQEPRRLFKRYAVTNTQFLFYSAREMLFRRA